MNLLGEVFFRLVRLISWGNYNNMLKLSFTHFKSGTLIENGLNKVVML